MFQIDEHIFPLGWFNHQLDMVEKMATKFCGFFWGVAACQYINVLPGPAVQVAKNWLLYIGTTPLNSNSYHQDYFIF